LPHFFILLSNIKYIKSKITPYQFDRSKTFGTKTAEGASLKNHTFQKNSTEIGDGVYTKQKALTRIKALILKAHVPFNNIKHS
jgi:hypothetical protein